MQQLYWTRHDLGVQTLSSKLSLKYAESVDKDSILAFWKGN